MIFLTIYFYFITFTQMINFATGSAQVPAQANSRTNDDGEAAFNEDAFEESEHVSETMFGDSVESGQDTVEDEGGVCQIMTSVSLKINLLRQGSK